MKRSVETYQAVEKVFCAYIKIVLTRSSRGYFRAQYKHFNRSIPLEEVQEINFCTEADLNINIPVSDVDRLDEYMENEILSAIISTLNSKDKQLLYMKYFEDKTDYQLSLIFGVTQQSMTSTSNTSTKGGINPIRKRAFPRRMMRSNTKQKCGSSSPTLPMCRSTPRRAK